MFFINNALEFKYPPWFDKDETYCKMHPNCVDPFSGKNTFCTVKNTVYP
jgi:hypothetical protein